MPITINKLRTEKYKKMLTNIISVKQNIITGIQKIRIHSAVDTKIHIKL